MNAPALPGRPRLQPGVPAGGVAALAVAGVMLVWGLVAGEAEVDHDFDFPHPPEAPALPHPPLPPHPVLIQPEAFRGIVEEALRDVDVEAIRREAMAAAEEARREMEGLRADITDSAVRGAQDNVRGHGADQIDATFDAAAGVRLVNLRGELVVIAGAPGRVRLVIEEGGRQLRTSVGDGLLTVAGPANDRPVSGRLEVPADSHVYLAAFSGDMALGDGFHGDLTAEIINGDIAADQLNNAAIQIHSRGDVAVDHVVGKLGLAIHGRGDVAVDQVGALSLELHGSSSIAIDHVLGSTVLSVPGRADIHIGEVSGPVKAAFMGSGEIVIDEGMAEELDVALLGSGHFTFNGTAMNPELFLGGSGMIMVPNIQGEPRIQRAGSGQIITQPQ